MPDPITPEPTPVVDPVTPAPAPAPSPAPVSLVNEDGSWNRDSFQDDLGKHSILDKYTTPQDLIKAAIGKDEIIGRKIDDLVASDNPDIVAGLKKRNGVPSTADDYELTFPDGFDNLPEANRTAIAEYVKGSADWALENGVPKEIFEKFVARDVGRAVEVYNETANAQLDTYNEAEAALKSEWRNDFTNNVEKSDNMAKFLGMDMLIPYMEANPELRKAFFDGASKVTSDDRIIAANQAESMHTLEESLDDLDDRMMKYDGPTTDAAYQRLLDKKVLLLKKLPQDGLTIIS